MIDKTKPLRTSSGHSAKYIKDMEYRGRTIAYISSEAFRRTASQVEEEKRVCDAEGKPYSPGDGQSLWIYVDDGTPAGTEVTARYGLDYSWVPTVSNVPELDLSLPLLHADGERASLLINALERGDEAGTDTPYYVTSPSIVAYRRTRPYYNEDNNGLWYDVYGRAYGSEPGGTWEGAPELYNPSEAVVSHETSSGNVFADLKLRAPESRLLKAKLGDGAGEKTVGDFLEAFGGLRLIHLRDPKYRRGVVVYKVDTDVAHVSVAWLKPGENYDKRMGSLRAILRYAEGQRIPVPVVDFQQFENQLRHMFQIVEPEWTIERSNRPY